MTHQADQPLPDRGIFLRGLAMGAADVVPGVSGGTIALITGIYDRLLNSLAAADMEAVTLLLRGQVRQLWRKFDGRFLMVLLAGIATAVVVLAQLIGHLMTHYPLPLWSFFFGLVTLSAWVLWREEVASIRPATVVAFCVGMTIAVMIALAPKIGFVTGLPGFFLAGSLAICAMILPGISGSFILLIIGMYTPVITALTGLEWFSMAAFAAGCLVGLLLFSRLLYWVLAQARRTTMALLAGFLAGSLVTLWPWQAVLSTVVDRHGEMRVVQSHPITPAIYDLQQGDSQWLVCLAAAVLGAAVVGLSHRRVVVDSTGAC